MEMVSLNNYDHLRLVPKSLIGQEMVWKVMWTIINHLGKLHYSKCVDYFEKATSHNLRDHFVFEPEDMK